MWFSPIHLGFALGSNQWCARENGRKLFFTCHYGSFDWIRVCLTFDDPDPPLIWTEDLLCWARLPNPNNHHHSAPLVSETNDDLRKWWSSEKKLMEFMGGSCSVDREVLFSPIPNPKWLKSSENPCKTRHCWCSSLPKPPPPRFAWNFPIRKLLTWVLFLTFLAGSVSKSICFTSVIIFGRKDFGRKGPAIEKLYSYMIEAK